MNKTLIRMHIQTNYLRRIFLFLLPLMCATACANPPTNPGQERAETMGIEPDSIPIRNQQLIDTVKKYGPRISPTYQKAVCTELLIPIIEKFHKLNKTDKSRIRIITNQDIQTMLKENSPVPKGVYYALIEKGVGEPIDNPANVLPGDFVQFWTDTWGHCGIVKSIDPETRTMELYSSFPTTDGYGVQRFKIYEHSFFVRMK